MIPRRRMLEVFTGAVAGYSLRRAEGRNVLLPTRFAGHDRNTEIACLSFAASGEDIEQWTTNTPMPPP